MPVPRRRHCPSRRDRSRHHNKLTATGLVPCAKCGEPARPHHVCPSCGSYKGRVYKVIVTK